MQIPLLRETSRYLKKHWYEKLSGREWYRVRQGWYRVVYAGDDGARVVLVVKVGHRRDVYR